MTLVASGTALGLAAWLIARTALPALERRAHESGLVDLPGGRKRHDGALPLTGGIAVLLGVAIPSVGGVLLALAADGLGLPLPPEIAVHLPGVRAKAPELLAILAGAAIHLLLGHVDDRRGLSPWLRLGVEALCAAGVAALGARVTLFLPWPAAHWVLTIVFIVFTTNAVNFIDNMNGLMGGVVLIACLHLLVLAVATRQLFLAAILLCLAGGLLAFLPRNFPKARVIMGDAGSLPLGFLLAALSVTFTFAEDPVAVPGRLLPVVLPLLLLFVPLADGVTVVVSRLRRGVHPFTAGRDHLSHRLVALGLTPAQAVARLWLLAFLAGLPLPLVALLIGCQAPD